MSYEVAMKNHIVRMLAPGDHRHLSMTDAAQCKSCGKKMVYAKKEYNRLTRQYPDKFVRKAPQEGFDRKTENLGDMLQERIKMDTLYRNHLKTLAFGTPEERAREQKRMMNGFYEKYTGENTRTLIV